MKLFKALSLALSPSLVTLSPVGCEVGYAYQPRNRAYPYKPRNRYIPGTWSSSSTSKTYSGIVTHFDDNEYQCYEWNGKAKSALAQGHLFVATNYRLASPNPGQYNSEMEIKCGGGDYLCIKTPDNKEYMVIDWCNSSNCDFHEADHADVLVGYEDPSSDECLIDCEGYNNFKKGWTIGTCTMQLDPNSF